MEIKDLKKYFGSIAEAAQAADIDPSYVYRMGKPIKKPWSAVFEVLSDGKLKSGIKKYKK